MLRYFIIFLLLVFVCHSQNVDITICDENEEYIDCAFELDCQASCTAPHGKPCPRTCAERPCKCRQGFVRDGNLKCVPIDACNRETTTSESETCGENEIWITCAPLQSCQASCEYPQGQICPRMCSLIPCVCKNGYVRASSANSTCIPRDQCSVASSITTTTTTSSSSSSLQCGDNEQYNLCANPCQPTCTNPDRGPCPTTRCSEGCICMSGYRRENDSPNSPCIECPLS